MSATLAVIVCAALLQSCNSESVYEEPAYGYYTAEEINVIKAMAEAYGLSIELNENYYGSKKTLQEFEHEMAGLSSMLGEYEMSSTMDVRGDIICTSRKKERNPRALTRYVEDSGSWTGEEFTAGWEYKASVTIKWNMSEDLRLEQLKGSVTSYMKGAYDYNYTEIGKGTLSCSLLGPKSIEFNGSFTAEVEKENKKGETESVIQYSFRVGS